MTWIILSIVPPLLWAIVNHIDKYLLSKAPHESSVNVLMVYSTGFSIIVLPILWLISPVNLFADHFQVLIQVISGVLVTISIYFYLLALNRDEASNVIPLALLVPVFGYLFGYLLLGETLSPSELFACLIIVGGSLILSLEFGGKSKIHFKFGVLFLMIFCSAFQAGQETLFKFVTTDNSTIVSLFWMHVGILICGICLLSWYKNLWSEFAESIKINGKVMFALNIGSEGLSALAYMIANYATLFAPIALVLSLNSYQPAFVFVLGTIFTLLAPRFVTEKIKPINLFHKSLAIGVMIAGTYLIV